jgi:hypothetical protein
MGLALLLAGLVTHVFVSMLGFVLFVLGAIGWWREVLPHEHDVRVAVQSDAERAHPIVPRETTVAHLVSGSGLRHRMRLPVEVRPLRSGLGAGYAGAIAMAVIACTYGLIAHHSVWFPINLLAGSLLPSAQDAGLSQLLEFDGTAFAVALLMHATISPLMGLVYAAVLPMLPGRPLLWGGLVAPLAWTALAWPALGILNPALAEHVSWSWFIASQVGFGWTAGFVLSKVEPIAMIQTLPLVERVGIESPGLTEPNPSDDPSGDGVHS